MLLCGVGGQGILFATRVLAETAFKEGTGVTISETHGMAQRGGSVVSHLLLGGFRSSMIRHGAADLIIGFNLGEGIRGLPFLKKGGLVVLNNGHNREIPAAFRSSLESVAATSYAMDASGTARALGAPVAANLVLIGFASALEGFPLKGEKIRQTIERLSPPRFLEPNLKAFDAGHDKAGES